MVGLSHPNGLLEGRKGREIVVGGRVDGVERQNLVFVEVGAR
jgi:hypothetical protein